MKKRKELNALIGLGGGSSERGSGTGGSNGRKKRRPRKGSASGHRLLRTESAESSSSSSSDPDYGDGFGLPGARSRFAKGDYLRCCKLCYPLCAFVILAACVVACVGLVWMQVALKEDLDGLKERFRTMESNQKTSFQEIPRLTEDLLSKQRQLVQLESGDMGLNKIWLNITEINKQISLLMSAVNHLKGNIKSASDLINLPITVEELQKSVATIGNTVTSVHHDVETMQATIEEHKRTIEVLQNQMSEHTKDGGKKLPSVSASPVSQISEKNLTDSCKQDNQYLHTSIEEVNSTLMVYQKLNDLKLFSMDSTISNLSWRVASLENHMVVVDKLERKENLTLSVVRDITTSANVEDEHEPRNESTAEKVQNMEKIENGESQVSKLREKLQLINALSSKPENDRTEASKKVGKPQSTTSQPTKLPRLYSRSLGSSVEGNRQPRDLSLPGISNIEDLQDLFKTTNEGKLSYEDLESLVGPTEHNSQSFKEFDTDGDEKYSLPELRVALGV